MLWMSRADAGRIAAYEPADSIERGESSTGWAWDAEFFDYDLDGDDDLYVLNGSNEYLVFATRFIQDDNPDSERPAWRHLNHDRESNGLSTVNQGGKLRNRSAESGANFYGNSRAAAFVDWDEDGDLDNRHQQLPRPGDDARKHARRAGSPLAQDPPRWRPGGRVESRRHRRPGARDNGAGGACASLRAWWRRLPLHGAATAARGTRANRPRRP